MPREQKGDPTLLSFSSHGVGVKKGSYIGFLSSFPSNENAENITSIINCTFKVNNHICYFQRFKIFNDLNS